MSAIAPVRLAAADRAGRWATEQTGRCGRTVGHSGRADDPLYRCRRLLTAADERLTNSGRAKLLGLLEGDPHGEVRMAWHAKEVLRSIYAIDDPALAKQFVARLSVDLRDADCPPETRQLGRTIARWANQIVAWHRSRVSNGPTEAVNAHPL